VTGGAPPELRPGLAFETVTVARTDRLRLGVLVSGRGSNLQAILDASIAGEIPADVVAVACNRPHARAVERARVAGVPTELFPHEAFGKRAVRDAAIVDFLRKHFVDLVVLAGYDRFLAPIVLETFKNRMINIHPSLLPAFGGTLHAQAEAIKHGVKVSGCTVFFVNEEPDAGPIILQQAVGVEEDDTVDSLSDRILVEEHRILTEAIGLIAAGRVAIEGRRCRILPPP
jgi:phosphoribosylglycinamide formyltransferase-1